MFDCTGALCGGGDGIVIQIARDPAAVPGGPEAAGNRAKDNVVIGNVIEGDIPDGFEAFDMAGVFVFAADRTVVARNRLSLPDNPNADAEGIGVLVDNSCCGLPAIVPGARNTGGHVQRRPRQPARRRRSTAPAAKTRRAWCCSATPAPCWSKAPSSRGARRATADSATPAASGTASYSDGNPERVPKPSAMGSDGQARLRPTRSINDATSTPCSRTRARWSASSWERWPTGSVCPCPSVGCAPRGGRGR